MSFRLVQKVWDSPLPSRFKPLCAAMAQFGNDAGEQIFPSVGRLAQMLGIGERSVQKQLKRLREMGGLVPVSSRKGGRRHTVHYCMVLPLIPILKGGP